MIIYFSGTGNSLAIARKVAEALGEQLMSMYDAVNANLLNERHIGLVFPTYNLDAPIAVTRLVKQIVFPKDAYTFIVITCGAQTNNAVWSVRRLLKQQGVRLDYCHKIRVPDSSALAFGRNPNDQSWKFTKFASRLDTIIAELQAEKHRLHYSGFDPLGWLLSFPNLQHIIAKYTTPKVNPDRCVGCGICAKVCPQENITLTVGKAVIAENCTLCLSCVHFCPHQAVTVNGKTITKEQQYHHPQVKLKDMIKR